MCKVVSINTDEAMKQDGAVAWVGYKDVPGMNSSSLVPGEEPLFAEEGKDIMEGERGEREGRKEGRKGRKGGTE